MGRPTRDLEVSVVVPNGAYTPALFRTWTEGRTIRKAELAFTRKGSRYHTLKMTDVVIASARFGGIPAGLPPSTEMTLVPRELKVLVS